MSSRRSTRRVASPLASLTHEVRLAVRSLAARPVFTLTAILLLALGLGVTTAVFSVVRGVLLRPLPVADEDRLVRAWKHDLARGFDHFPILYPELEAWRDRSTSFESLAAVSNEGSWVLTLERDGEPSPLRVAVVSDAYFDVLGVQPVPGRGFVPTDATSEAEWAGVLSHETWQRRFGGDSEAVGRSLEIHGHPVRVVGVAPRGFALPAGAELWLCLPREGLRAELEVLARLRPGVTLAAARADLQRVVRDWEAAEGLEPREVVAVSLREALVGDVRRPLAALLGAAGLLLLVACANLAHLLVLETLGRRRQFGIQAALGAGAGRIVCGVLVETGVLAAAGCGLALLLGWLAVRAVRLLPVDLLPRLDQVKLDLPVLTVAALAALIAGGLAALIPAMRAARIDPAEALRGGRDGAGGAEKSGGLRGMPALVVAEVALSLTLALGAGLLVRSFLVQQGIERGFSPDRMLAVALYPPPKERPRRELIPDLLSRLESLPGVEAATASLNRPLAANDGFDALVRVEGQSPEQAADNPWVNLEAVTPGFATTFGTTLRSGRFFSPEDTAEARPVAVVNRTFAERYWPGQEAVGKQIHLGPPEWPWRAVVGVVEDLRYRHLTDRRPDLLLPATQSPWQPSHLSLRAAGSLSPAAVDDLIPAVRREIRHAAPRTAVEITRMDTVYDRGLATPRFQALLTATFAGLALSLMAAGLYGVLATGVARRRRELGIRLALGARRGWLVARVLQNGLLLAGLGAGLGLLLTLALSRWLDGLLYGVTATDPTTYVVLSAALLAVAALASWWPAQRAARIDPAETLRQE